MKKYSLLLLSLIFAASCDKTTDEAPKDPNQIYFSAIHPSAVTRASDAGFDANNKIGVFAVEYAAGVAQPLQIGGNFLNNEPLTYTGGKWTPGRKLYWGTEALDFYAYYPHVKVNSVNALVYELATDQRTAGIGGVMGGYEASDFLYAKSTNVARAGGDVKLRFEHIMTKVKVKIVKGATFEGKLPEDISVNIYNTVTTATINLVIGSATKYRYGSKKTIHARKIAPDMFEAIVVPQYIDILTPLVEVTMGGISYLLEYNISLRPGYEHTINVVVNTSPDQEKIEISIDGSTHQSCAGYLLYPLSVIMKE